MWYAIEGHDGPDVLARRLEARADHLARLLALRDEGRLLLAGPCPAIDAEDPGPAMWVTAISRMSGMPHSFREPDMATRAPSSRSAG